MQSSANWSGGGGVSLAGWGGEVCVCALLNKLRPACSSSLLVISSKNIFKFLRGTFSDTEK